MEKIDFIRLELFRESGNISHYGIFDKVTGESFKIDVDVYKLFSKNKSLIDTLEEESLLEKVFSPYLESKLIVPHFSNYLISSDGGKVNLFYYNMADINLPRQASSEKILKMELDELDTYLLLQSIGSELKVVLEDSRWTKMNILSRLWEFMAIDFQFIRLSNEEKVEKYHFSNLVYSNVIYGEKSQPTDTYYKKEKIKPQFRFELIEPTVSFAFRRKTELLGGSNFGESLSARFVETDSKAIDILELGVGTGDVFNGVASNLIERDVNYSYDIVDLSQNILKRVSDKHKLDNTDLYCFDIGERFKIDKKYDYIICNEVIADINPEKLYGKTLNFLWNIKESLKSGGRAYISEFGYLDSKRETLPIFHLDHYEWEVDFSKLSELASSIGLKAKVIKLENYLNWEEDIEVFSSTNEKIEILNFILRTNKQKEIEKRVYSKKEIVKILKKSNIKILNLSFGFLRTTPYWGPDIAQFYVLHLEKPLLPFEI